MDIESASLLIFLLMLIQAIICWIFALIKEWDVSKRGEANEYGIESTFCSRLLDIGCFLMTAAIFVLSVVHLVAIGDKRHDMPFINYFIIVNMCVMILM